MCFAIQQECKLSKRRGTMMICSENLILDKIQRLPVITTLALVSRQCCPPKQCLFDIYAIWWMQVFGSICVPNSTRPHEYLYNMFLGHLTSCFNVFDAVWTTSSWVDNHRAQICHARWTEKDGKDRTQAVVQTTDHEHHCPVTYKSSLDTNRCYRTCCSVKLPAWR